MAPTMEGQLKRCLGSSYVPGQCLHSTYDLESSGRIFIPLKCFVLSLVIVDVIFRLQFNSGSDNFFLWCEQSFWFATALASKTVVDEVRGSSVLVSLARESAISFPSMSTWARIHWRVHDLPNAPMENRSELISWVNPIYFIPCTLAVWYGGTFHVPFPKDVKLALFSCREDTCSVLFLCFLAP
ncbi:uncharacterized protein TNCV_2305291 [Trichonephila clavipes]|nr:uncharacterized protein TNCV_2305291 [Trichonephila clavipes]